jgi:hypothetical protein
MRCSLTIRGRLASTGQIDGCVACPGFTVGLAKKPLHFLTGNYQYKLAA